MLYVKAPTSMARSKALVAIAAVLLCGTGISHAQQPCVTSYQSAAKNDELTYVAQAMEVTGLATTFNSTTLKATIFLPKNEAFDTLFSSLGLTANQVLNTSSPFIPYLGQILEYHVIPNQVIYAANFTQGEVLISVINETLTVGLDPLTITPTGGKAAAVTFTDFIACAAIEHVLDTVLLPKSVIQAYTAAQGAATPAVVTKTPVLPAIALPPVAVTTVTPVTPVPVPIVTAAAPVPAAVAPMVQSAAGPDVIPGSVAVSFATAPAISPMPAMPTAAPYVSTTTTVAPVLPAVTATTEAPATMQTPVLSAVTQPIQDKEAQVVAAATPVVSQVQSQVDALKQKVKPTPIVVTPVQTPPAPVQVSGLAVAAPPPPVVVLDKKADLLSTLKDKLLPAAAPPPPAPVAISGAPLSTTSVVKPKNLTALQLPQLDIPVPEKPQIDLPSVPAVPVYQFQLPDIKTELESAVLPVVDKAKSLLPQGTPPPPVQISGTAISGAPITVPPPPPSVLDIPVLPPKKKPFFLLKKKTPLALVDKLKEKLLAPALTQVALTPPPAMPVSGGVSGISGIDQQPAGLPKALTLAVPQDAAAPVEFTFPPLPAVQLPEKDLANKSLPHYSKKKDGPLVIHVPILDSLSSNSVTSTVSSVVTPNDYTITEPGAYASASGSATAGSASSSTTVTAQAGPAVVPTLPNTNATVYDASATCATVPKTAQMVPDMTDFLAGLQVTGLDTKLNDPTAMMTVFVPINTAFDALAQQLNSSVPALLTQTDMLSQILEYHVVPGMSMSASNLTDGQVLQTLLPGQSITVQKSGNAIKLLSSDSETSATIVYPDVRACNAIILVIDTVLSPAASAAAAAAPTVAQAAPVLPAISLQATATQPAAAVGGR